MTDAGRPFDRIIQTLQERAKELNCLYRVDELLGRQNAPLEDIFKETIQIIPAGWQHPGLCRARLFYLDKVYHAQDFMETEWRQSSAITVQGRDVGRLEVFYLEAPAGAGNGPFLKEEQKLLDTIADRIGQVIHHRDLKTAFERLEPGAERPQEERRQEWCDHSRLPADDGQKPPEPHRPEDDQPPQLQRNPGRRRAAAARGQLEDRRGGRAGGQPSRGTTAAG